MRFLHAADVHLDSPLRGLDEYEGAPFQSLRGATPQAFAALVQLALAERVDFVILAGDLYDGDWPDFNTGLFFVSRVQELVRSGIPVVFFSGNHDAASRITARLTLPANVHALPTGGARNHTVRSLACRRARTRVRPAGRDTQLGSRIPRTRCRLFQRRRPAHRTGWSKGSRPLCALHGRRIGGPRASTLGHWGTFTNVNRPTAADFRASNSLATCKAGTWASPGQGCLLVTVDGDAQAVPEFRPLDVFRWETVAVNAAAAESVADVLESARAELSDARDRADGRPLAARLVISCSESVSLCLASDPEQFRANLRGQAGGDVWIEKIKVAPARTAQLKSRH